MSAKGRRQAKAGENGFTLIEIMVVLVLSLGIVTTVSILYRSSAHTLQSLKGGQKDWYLQQNLRAQLGSLFFYPAAAELVIAGTSRELNIPTWKSRQAGYDGRPVLASYSIDPEQRSIRYQEVDLPAWWGPESNQIKTLFVASSVQARAPVILIRGVEDAEFSYLEPGKEVENTGAWQTRWDLSFPPQLIRLRFNHAGRNYDLWLEPKNLAD